MNKEDIEESLFAALDWDDIPMGSYLVRISKTRDEIEVELIDE